MWFLHIINFPCDFFFLPAFVYKLHLAHDLYDYAFMWFLRKFVFTRDFYKRFKVMHFLTCDFYSFTVSFFACSFHTIINSHIPSSSLFCIFLMRHVLNHFKMIDFLFVCFFFLRNSFHINYFLHHLNTWKSICPCELIT